MLWDVLAAVRTVFSTPKRPASHQDRPSNKRARIHAMADSTVDDHQAGQSSLVAGPAPCVTHELDTSSPHRPFAAARLSDLTPRRTLPSQRARTSATIEDAGVRSSGQVMLPLQQLYAVSIEAEQYGQPLPFTPPNSIFRSLAPVVPHPLPCAPAYALPTNIDLRGRLQLQRSLQDTHASYRLLGSPAAAHDTTASPPMDDPLQDEAVNDLEYKRREALKASRAAEAVRGRSKELLGRFADMSLAWGGLAESSFATKADALNRSMATAKQALRINAQVGERPLAAKAPVQVVLDEDATPDSQDDVLLYGVHPHSEEEVDDLLVETLPVEGTEEQEWARYKEVTSSRGNASETLVDHEASQIMLDRSTLRCMAPGTWLNDEVVNVFLCLLQARDARRRTAEKATVRCHLWNTFFATKLFLNSKTYQYSNVKRWTRARSLKKWGQVSAHPFDCDLIFVPVNYERQHWAAAVVYLKEQRISYYDSLGGFNQPLIKALAEWVSDEYAQSLQREVDTSTWTLDAPPAPQQHNGCDCGMFMLAYAEHLSRGAPLLFSQQDMPWLRCLYTNQILRQHVP